MTVRPAVFAGSWYPSRPEECQRQIEEYFHRLPVAPAGVGVPLGGIVPHAGWTFSGRLAGAVVGMLREGGSPDTVILFGGHLGPLDRHLLMAEGAWDTPLGPLEVDGQMARALREEFPFLTEESRGAQPDNTRELQLPLIAYGFPDARILPVATAPTRQGIQIGERCARLARELGRTVLVLGSTDLTHYGPGYGFTPQGRGPRAERWVREVQDPRVIREMETMNPEGILNEALANHNACCPGAAAAAVACVKVLGARTPQVIDYATSADVLPGEDFVGYVGVIYWS
jgi:AmmeMemoRadiSam system protein B